MDSDGHADQRGSCGGMEGKQEVCGAAQICMSKEETKKSNGVKKNENE